SYVVLLELHSFPTRRSSDLSGKTFALWFPVILEYIQNHPDTWQKPRNNGIQLIWVTPLRALAQDIQKAMQEVCNVIGLPWQVARSEEHTSELQSRENLVCRL